MFEAVGSYAAGTITADDLEEFENKTCPTSRIMFRYVHCEQHELPDRGSRYGTERKRYHPAVYSERIRLAKHAGMQVMEMYRRNIRPRDIMTKEALLNALL